MIFIECQDETATLPLIYKTKKLLKTYQYNDNQPYKDLNKINSQKCCNRKYTSDNEQYPTVTKHQISQTLYVQEIPFLAIRLNHCPTNLNPTDTE
jgi:hypothetical protein